MNDSSGPTDASERRRYDETLERAMQCAVPHVGWDQAFEVAHDVACEMLRRPESEAAEQRPSVPLSARVAAVAIMDESTDPGLW